VFDTNIIKYWLVGTVSNRRNLGSEECRIIWAVPCSAVNVKCVSVLSYSGCVSMNGVVRMRLLVPSSSMVEVYDREIATTASYTYAIALSMLAAEYVMHWDNC
jgi:hypothetical protein